MLAELKRATLTLLRQGNWLGGTALTLDPATLDLQGRPAVLELRPDGFAVRLGR